MAKKNGGFSKTQAKALCKELDAQVSQFQKALKNMQNDINALQKGGADGPYWNGQLAYTWVKTTLAHIDHDKVLLDHLDKCSDFLSVLVAGGTSL